MAISENLKIMREQFGYSIADIAEYLKVSEESVQLMEYEDVYIASITLEKLCDLYGCDPSFIYVDGFEENRMIAGPEMDLTAVAAVNRLARNLNQMEKIK